MDRNDKFLLSRFLLNCLRRWLLMLGIFSPDTQAPFPLPSQSSSPPEPRAVFLSLPAQPSLSNPCPRSRCLTGQPPAPNRSVSSAPRPRGSHYRALLFGSAAPESRLFPLLPRSRPVLISSERDPLEGLALTFPVIAGSCRHLCCPTSVGIGE